MFSAKEDTRPADRTRIKIKKIKPSLLAINIRSRTLRQTACAMTVFIQTRAQISLLNAASARPHSHEIIGGNSIGTKHHWSYYSYCLLKKYFDLGESVRPAGTLHARLKVSAFREVQFCLTILTSLSVMFFLLELSGHNTGQSTNALLRSDNHLYTDSSAVVSTLHHSPSASALGKIDLLFTLRLTIPWTPLSSLLDSTVRNKGIVLVEKVVVFHLVH